ncbi:MAG: tyrosine-type recombinase/integrase [Bacteroidota bacterium]|nr:tyrosine-type recombinase/integrase [Bacteroidota bacterium]
MELSDYLKSRYTPATVKAYKREIEIFKSNLPGAENARYKDILKFIGSLRMRYSNPRTIGRMLGSIKAYYDYLCYTGIRNDNPAGSILLKDNKDKAIQLQDLFSPEELESILEIKSYSEKLDLRNKVLMSLLIYQGLKPGDIEILTVNDINLTKGIINIKATTKRNSRYLQLKAQQIMIFYRYINLIRPKLLGENRTDILIIGQTGNPLKAEDIIKLISRNYRDLFKGRKVTAGTIRQSVITNLLKSGHDLRLVQAFAGHKYTSSTEQYKQTNAETLKAEINRYHPIK